MVRFIDMHWEEQDAQLGYVSVGSDQSRYPKEKIASWYQKVFDQGWGLVDWPANAGGVSWDATQKYIWMSECARRCIPSPSHLPGVALVGPLLVTLENNNQKIDKFLRGIRNNDTSWGIGQIDLDWNQTHLRLVKTEKGFSIKGREVVCCSGADCDWALVLCQEGKDEFAVLIEVGDRLSERVSGEVGVISTTLFEIEFDNEKIIEEQVFLIPKGPQRKEIMKLLLTNGAFYQSPSFLKRSIDQLRALAINNKMDTFMIRRLAELDIELKSLEAFEMRALFGQDQKMKNPLNLAQLSLMTLDLTVRTLEAEVDILAYDSIPLEDPLKTHNEPSLGPEGSEYAIEKLLYISAWSEGVRSRVGMKDQLAKRLEIAEYDEI